MLTSEFWKQIKCSGADSSVTVTTCIYITTTVNIAGTAPAPAPAESIITTTRYIIYEYYC